MKRILITLVALAVVGAGAYFLMASSDSVDVPQDDDQEEPVDTPATTTDETATTTEDESADDEATDGENDEAAADEADETVIGTSVEGRDIVAHHYGDGSTELLFVGGIHGSYGWNTVLTARELTDYLAENPNAVPSNVSVTVIPTLNPDGLAEVVGTAGEFTADDVTMTREETTPGRFNANDVDLNRNFDCQWQSEGTWQNRAVDAGSAPFSEPESQAVRDYVSANTPDAAVVFYSAAGAVYSSSCEDDVMTETDEIMNTYADASGYEAAGLFDAYEISGDMVNWMAKQDIPAISVLLSNHQDVEWSENKAGIDAFLNYYAE